MTVPLLLSGEVQFRAMAPAMPYGIIPARRKYCDHASARLDHLQGPSRVNASGQVPGQEGRGACRIDAADGAASPELLTMSDLSDTATAAERRAATIQIGRASCRERVGQYW